MKMSKNENIHSIRKVNLLTLEELRTGCNLHSEFDLEDFSSLYPFLTFYIAYSMFRVEEVGCLLRGDCFEKLSLLVPLLVRFIDNILL